MSRWVRPQNGWACRATCLHQRPLLSRYETSANQSFDPQCSRKSRLTFFRERHHSLSLVRMEQEDGEGGRLPIRSGAEAMSVPSDDWFGATPSGVINRFGGTRKHLGLCRRCIHYRANVAAAARGVVAHAVYHDDTHSVIRSGVNDRGNRFGADFRADGVSRIVSIYGNDTSKSVIDDREMVKRHHCGSFAQRCHPRPALFPS